MGDLRTRLQLLEAECRGGRYVINNNNNASNDDIENERSYNNNNMNANDEEASENASGGGDVCSDADENADESNETRMKE